MNFAFRQLESDKNFLFFDAVLLFLLFYGFNSMGLFDRKQEDFGCRDRRWRMTTDDSFWNTSVSIWIANNISLISFLHGTIPGVRKSFRKQTYFNSRKVQIKFMSSTVDVDAAQTTLSGCRSRGEDAFFNCKDCPSRLVLEKSSTSSPFYDNIIASDEHTQDSDDTAPSMDLLLVFNSWGETSRYHVFIDTVFPVWATVSVFRDVFQQPVRKITLLNIRGSDPHRTSVQPAIEVLL